MEPPANGVRVVVFSPPNVTQTGTLRAVQIRSNGRTMSAIQPLVDRGSRGSAAHGDGDDLRPIGDDCAGRWVRSGGLLGSVGGREMSSSSVLRPPSSVPVFRPPSSVFRARPRAR